MPCRASNSLNPTRACSRAPGDLALRYGFGQGPSSIRRWLAARRSEAEGFDVREDAFQIANGSSGAIDLVVRSLIDPGDVIIAENPTYMGTLHNFRGVGADVRCVPVDEHGMDVDALEVLLERLAEQQRRVKLIYTISAYQNPSGAVLSAPRRLRLLELAARFDAMVLDDEAYRDLWFEEPPPRAISASAEGWGVITVGTFSKTVATGIRVGYIHAHPDLLALFGRMRFAMGQNQHALRAFGDFLDRGCFEPHLASVRALYAAKAERLHQALLAEGVNKFMDWQTPAGGFYLWARLREGLDREALWRTGIEEGIAVNNGAGFTPLGNSRNLRIAYSWTPADQFEEAARRLRRACERVASGDRA